MKPIKTTQGRARRHRTAAVAVSVAVLLAACGGDNGTSDPGNGAPTTTPGAPSPTDTGTEGGSGVSPEEAAALFEGKVVQILLPVAPGGGVDATGSFVARYLGNYIPGNPQVQVVHEPGGGTVNGANLFETRYPADGTVVFLSTTSTYIQQLAENEAVIYDYTTWQPLAADCGQSGVALSTATGFDGSNYEDLTDIAPVTLGLSGWTSAQSVYLLAFEAMGIPVRPVPGYEGTAELLVAFQQGETTVGTGGHEVWVDHFSVMFDEGTAAPLFTFPRRTPDGELYSDPMAPEGTPTVQEAYELIHGEPPSGELWQAVLDLAAVSYNAQNGFWYHPDVPQEYVEVMRDAFEALAESDEFKTAQAEADLLCGETLITGQALGPAVAEMQNFVPGSFELWLDILRSHGYSG